MASNELRHWGIKGMRWGVRRTHERSAAEAKTVANNKLREPSRFQKWNERNAEKAGLGNAKTQANDRARAERNKADYKSGKIDRKEYMRRDQAHAMEIARRIDNHTAEKRAAKKEARLKASMNKPMDYRNRNKHMSAFKKALIGVGTASAVAISTTLIRNVLNSPSGKSAANRGGEILARKIAEAKLGLR